MKNSLLIFSILTTSVLATAAPKNQEVCIELLQQTFEYQSISQPIKLYPIKNTSDFYSSLSYRTGSGDLCDALYLCTQTLNGYEIYFSDDSCGGR